MIKVLSIDPGSRHLGFADFDELNLADWGVKTVKQDSIDILLQHVEGITARLIEEKNPDYLVIRQDTAAQIKVRLRKALIVNWVRRAAKAKKVTVYDFGSMTIGEEICGNRKACQRDVAKTLAVYYPELSRYVKLSRESMWRYHKTALLAVAGGVTFLRQHVSSVFPIAGKPLN